MPQPTSRMLAGVDETCSAENKKEKAQAKLAAWGIYRKKCSECARTRVARTRAARTRAARLASRECDSAGAPAPITVPQTKRASASNRNFLQRHM
eukprot:6213799-Pleurochrysis_carterae.AAC.14